MKSRRGAARDSEGEGSIAGAHVSPPRRSMVSHADKS